jgi:ATP:corrinoid adenosyltransferase
MDVQARLPPALSGIHNFIREYDPDEISDFIRETQFDDFQLGGRNGELAQGPPTIAARERARVRRDAIAQEMWEQYQQVIEDCALGLDLTDEINAAL